MKNALKGINGLFNISIFTSVVILVIGIFLFIQPDTVIRMISIVLGIIFLIPGITALIDYFKEKNSASLVLGVITILVSLILIIKTDLVASILPFILGIYFVVNGITRLQYALELKKNGYTSFTTSLVFSLLIMLCGILFILNPFEGAMALTQMIGMFMIIYACLDITNTVVIKRGMKVVTKEMKNAVIEIEAEEKND